MRHDPAAPRRASAPAHRVHRAGAPARHARAGGVLPGRPGAAAGGRAGWCRSAWLERHSTLELPAPAQPALAWFVREAWPSPATRTSATEGALAGGDRLTLSVASDELVAFGDGIESDTLPLSWGQSVTIGVAERSLNLVGP
ncbi:MAG TPA: hypothetical protein VGG25_18585 [Streptosporangiaceae bacterium]